MYLGGASACLTFKLSSTSGFTELDRVIIKRTVWCWWDAIGSREEGEECRNIWVQLSHRKCCSSRSLMLDSDSGGRASCLTKHRLCPRATSELPGF
ncbi:hypothetical protein OJAV_G00034190 [Oryzias javanicus]|uniref:Uncharacterized protein n=1 Tax=Oryzias javanicus TaxID=123683 RepID=A0A3S2PHA6_ORYJA|nr:hypothetical protein OJAV_G00034190 [Oryzias javanicus]